MTYTSPAQEAGSTQRLIWAVKNTARGLIWRTLEQTGAHRLMAPFRSNNCLILYYRAVFDGPHQLPIDSDNVLDADVFEKQMVYLKAHRRVISLGECFDHWQKHGAPPRKSAVITFDDGFACCRTVAAPILKSLDLPATFFVIPGFTESDEPKWDDFLRQVTPDFRKWIIRSTHDEIRREMDRLRETVDADMVSSVEERLREGMLTWEQMSELLEMGFSVQSHSQEHWYLSSQSEEVQRREIVDSKTHLEEKLGPEVRFFSIPFGYPGSFNSTTLALLQRHGYAAAFGGHRGYLTAKSDPYAMPRIVIHRGFTFPRFQAAVSGALI